MPNDNNEQARVPNRISPDDRYRPSQGPAGKRSRLRAALIVASVWLVLSGAIAFSYWVSDLPDTSNLFVYDPGNDVTVLDAKGRLIARRGLTQGARVAVGELPAYVGNAFIAVEDRRFRHHFGIDPIGLLRAGYTDATHGAFVQGGSTITQQLAKNLFLQPDRTFKRKIEEAILAVYLENRYSKDEILTQYLNRVYFGAGVYGIEAASERFFDKPAGKLSLTEAAMLAGSVKAPSRYNPEASQSESLERASVVLEAMQDGGFISHTQRVAAAGQRPKIVHSFGTPGAGYFVDYVISRLPELIEKPQERLIIETTLDLDLQRDAEAALEAGLAKDGMKLAAHEGALVAMTPDGALRALVGGISYDETPFDRATEARRQPGSAFKPFVYLAALEHGYRPNDEVFDGPVTIGNWRPTNYEGEYEGPITLAHALAHSSNSAAVQLANEVGLETVAGVAHRLGISDPLQAVPSLALGTSEVTPLELTAGYAAFANGGMAVTPFEITRIRTASGKVLYQHTDGAPSRVMSPENDAFMTMMMTGTVIDGTGTAAALGVYPVAGKTGTSQDYRDAWFVGFSADYVTAVWIGNDAGDPMRKATGGGLPARIFKTFMVAAERGLPARPLVGTTLLAADEVPGAPAAPEQTSEATKPKNDGDLLSVFQQLLDKIFR